MDQEASSSQLRGDRLLRILSASQKPTNGPSTGQKNTDGSEADHESKQPQSTAAPVLQRKPETGPPKDTPAQQSNLQALNQRVPTDGQALPLMYLDGRVSVDALLKLLRDSNHFLTVGVLGGQGVGKSTIMNLIAMTESESFASPFTMRPLHPPVLEDTEGPSIEVYVSSERIILLDTAPEILTSTPKATTHHQNAVEDSLRFILWLLGICHAVICVSDSPVDRPLWNRLKSAWALRSLSQTPHVSVMYMAHMRTISVKGQKQLSNKTRKAVSSRNLVGRPHGLHLNNVPDKSETETAHGNQQLYRQPADSCPYPRMIFLFNKVPPQQRNEKLAETISHFFGSTGMRLTVTTVPRIQSATPGDSNALLTSPEARGVASALQRVIMTQCTEAIDTGVGFSERQWLRLLKPFWEKTQQWLPVKLYR
eukprot:Selendium_serpulae@DN1347_c0_g1_i2.p1